MSGIVGLLFVTIISVTALTAHSSERTVEVREHQLVIDGKKQPQLFGAELQYFRLRGGYGPNIPRSEVLILWKRALDHFVKAKMNAISFYIPWDFHEYAEGKFDFTGTVDVDGDGRADYPSRDLVTFFKLIADRGITRVMVRPGPYINAEWGFLGFGAIPSWFHDKFPQSHMRTPYGLRSRLYDYQSPDLIRYTELWFQALNEQVLKHQMGVGKPVIFLQLDNETNYQWQSLYNHDFGQSTIFRYQSFLKERYADLATLNQSHGRIWQRWNQVRPPVIPARNNFEDQDWYRFADHSIYSFLNQIRSLWLNIGVSEPNVLFTLAESYNAPENGLLPNFILRNSPQATGLMTVNLYPKTAEEPHKPLLNFPFKADLDVKSADSANDLYFGSEQEWVMGPEIQGGWWKGIEVSSESRQQTYLTVIGHGLKAFFVYYFNEGQNWDVEWYHEQLQPFFYELRRERRLEDIAIDQLPEDFWNELQARSDRSILVGFDVRRAMKLGPHHDDELFFDAPLDGQANPRTHYWNLKTIGERVIAPYQDFLARSVEAHDDVAIVKDSTNHLPLDSNIPSVQASADWTGGLLGYLMNADLNPRILHGDINAEVHFANLKMLVHLDTGFNAPRTYEIFKKAIARGQVVLNFLASQVPVALGLDILPATLVARNMSSVPLVFYVNRHGLLRPAGEPNTKAVEVMTSGPVYAYDLPSSCEGILYYGDRVVGYRCKLGAATFVQVGALIFDGFNSSTYAQMPSVPELEIFMKSIAREAKVKSQIRVEGPAERVVAFARKDPKQKLLWVTVKTATTRAQEFQVNLKPDFIRESLDLDSATGSNPIIRISDLMLEETQESTYDNFLQTGFRVSLGPNGSAVFVLKLK